MRIVFIIVVSLYLPLLGQGLLDQSNTIPYYITNIFLVGNHRTKEYIIRREMDIKEGQQISRQSLAEALEKNRNRIFNIGLFVNVQITADTSIKENTKLYVLVTERWYTIPTIVFELADRNFNEWWYQRNKDLSRVNYGFGLSQHNIRGRNETVKINLQGGFTKNLSGSYTFPFINKARTIGLNFGGGYSENKQVLVSSVNNKQVFVKSEDLLFSRSNLYTTLSYRRSFFTTHRMSYDFSRYYASDSVLIKNPEFFRNTHNYNTLHTIAYNLIHDKRNIQAYPTKGHLSYLDLKMQGILPYDYFKNLQVSFSHARYYSLGKKFFITHKVKFLISSNDKIPYLNLKTLGYSSDYIRGYDLYVIDASSYVYQKVNLRRKLFQYQVDLGRLMPLPQFRSFPVALYLNTYADVGYGYKKHPSPTNDLLLNRSLEGWGLGIDIVTAYDVVFRTEYSFNELGEHGVFFYVSTDVIF